MTTNKEEYMDQSFRDTIGTVDESGKRIWVYPKKPSGRYYKARTYLSYLLLTILFSGPFIKINGQPILLLDILQRRFIIFGQVFWPQDFYIFVLIMLAGILFIVLFTVVYGRIFCGWICPQTIFMEMVFRKIEYWIEGDYKHQKRLNDGPWTKEKIRKKVLKHTIFFSISFIIANTFLAYFIGIERLAEMITSPPMNHISTLASLLIFTGIFYWVFSWFREQVCIVVCPYGRLQGVMLDKNSIVVAYDYIRGEMRGRFRKNENREEEQKGDCIDCYQCVDVCPTGIDIRNGTQLECINCTACIDACDFMMESVGLPKGLIRFDSEEGIVNKKSKKFTLRSVGYSIVLVLILGLMSFLLLSRTDVDTTVLKAPGQQYQKRDDNKVSNLYNYKIINKTFNDIPANIKIIDRNGEIELIGKQDGLIIPSESIAEGTFFLIQDLANLEDRKSTIYLGVYNEEGELIDKVKTTFIAPVKKRK